MIGLSLRPCDRVNIYSRQGVSHQTQDHEDFP